MIEIDGEFFDNPITVNGALYPEFQIFYFPSINPAEMAYRSFLKAFKELEGIKNNNNPIVFEPEIEIVPYWLRMRCI